jgi:hypothetical protein
VPKLAEDCARRLLPCQSASRLASSANRWSRKAGLASKRRARPVVGAKRKELALAAPFLQSEEAVRWKQPVGSLPSKLLACDDFYFGSPCWLPYDIHGAVDRLGLPGGSEHFQFVRHLPHECVFLVVGSDKLCSAEDFQDAMIFAFR